MLDLELGNLQAQTNTRPLVYCQVTIWPNRSLAGQLSLTYSLLPILAYPWLLLLWAVSTGSFQPVMALLSAVAAVVTNEWTLKPWIKEPRPAMCPIKNSYGMPSGHSLFSGLLLAYLWNFKSDYSSRFLLATALLPVPWARWHNCDHSDRQVVVGWTLGVCTGIVLALLIRV